MEWFVHIKDLKTNELVHFIGPYSSFRQAEKGDAGLNRNMDHERYYSEIVGPQPSLTERRTDEQKDL